jgi:hypothetical protein
MIRECFINNIGIQFYRDSFKAVGLDPDTLYPSVTRVTPSPKLLKPSYTTVTELRASADKAKLDEPKHTNKELDSIKASTFESEENEELADSISPIYDPLKLARGWWILEYLPMRHRVQRRQDTSPKRYYWSYVLFFSRSLCLFHSSGPDCSQDQPGPLPSISRTG